ncbi:endolytic transglycosylase MltG [bacterium]|nr:MAG: endolytic transglycosylase MltG [bacterium]
MHRGLESLFFLIIAAFGFTLTHVYIGFFTPISNDDTPYAITVPKGASLNETALNLKKTGLIKSPLSLTIPARFLGASRRVKAGEYELTASMSPFEILSMFIRGKIRTKTVTIPEGYNLQEIAEALKDARLLTDESEFIARAYDKRLITSLGIEGDSLEGYLFPDTYVFAAGTVVDEILIRMAEKFKTVYLNELDAEARKKNMSMKSVVTLASLIEKEAASSEERPLISAVFHNRLRKRIKLQSDPTAVYTLKDFSGTITRKHLLAKTPYNTYVIYGLPPGPIASPGKASLRAAMRPAKEDYLYFVSKNNGTHEFSKNLEEHNKAVKLYRKLKAKINS